MMSILPLELQSRFLTLLGRDMTPIYSKATINPCSTDWFRASNGLFGTCSAVQNKRKRIHDTMVSS